jgi:hypothetical protein
MKALSGSLEMKYGATAVRTLALTMVITTCFVLATAQTGRSDDGSNSTPPSFYVAFPSANQIGVVDPSTGEIEAVIPFRGGPTHMIVDPVRPIVYVVLGDQQIVALQTKYQVPLGSVSLPVACHSYAINASGSKLYASACGNQTIYIANTKTFSVTGNIQLPSNVGGIAISNRRHRLYAALPTLHSDAIINLDNGQIEKVKYLGQCRPNVCSPNEAAVSPDDRYLISVDQFQCETIAYDLQTGHVVGRTPYAGHQCFIAGVDTSANELWLVHEDRNFGISMDPPFGTLAEFNSRIDLSSAAFSPSGQGFGVGSAPGPYFRSHDFLVAYPTLLQTTTLWSAPFSVIYVP